MNNLSDNHSSTKKSGKIFQIPESPFSKCFISLLSPSSTDYLKYFLQLQLPYITHIPIITPLITKLLRIQECLRSVN